MLVVLPTRPQENSFFFLFFSGRILLLQQCTPFVMKEVPPVKRFVVKAIFYIRHDAACISVTFGAFGSLFSPPFSGGREGRSVPGIYE